MKGLLVLEDGTIIRGKGYGASATRVGELIFHTAMNGYQEILTDPVSAGQIVLFSYPLIGNYGISPDADESLLIQAAGLATGSVSRIPSHYTSQHSLPDWLFLMGIPAIDGVDTRALTRRLRIRGTAKCLITTEDMSPAEAHACCLDAEIRRDTMKSTGVTQARTIPGEGSRVAVLDLGLKNSTRIGLLDRGWAVTLWPWNTPAETILESAPDGILISDGPGDPNAVGEAVTTVRLLMQKSAPVFGMGLGHALMALAAGLKTFRMLCGHHGVNYGVRDRQSGASFITTQSHSFGVAEDSLRPELAAVTHVNLNDGTIEGLRYPGTPHFSVQFLPDAGKDADDTVCLFDRFESYMKGGVR